MKALKFRVQNFKNIDDSGWIPLEQVTAFVGRNESGKTTLLKALHKFNPAIEEPYDAQREFPRDRYTRDYVGQSKSKGGDWAVCSVSFSLSDQLQSKISAVLEDGQAAPKEAVLTRYYDGTLAIEYVPALNELQITPGPVLAALKTFAATARRLPASTPEQETEFAAQRTALAQWATAWHDKLQIKTDLRNESDTKLLHVLHTEAEGKSSPKTADMVETLQAAIAPVQTAAMKKSVVEQVDDIIETNLPVLIYFENYGILDSAIWLPRFLEDYNRNKTDARVRTINAMFKHVGLDAKDIASLGDEKAKAIRASGQQPTAAQIAEDQKHKEERAIRLNSASLDITEKFSKWWSQRRHQIEYQADGDYFRIWVTDDRRPGVKIELEARSKGFQWFFSFYLVFLVESEEGHKDAILLLDEPGVHLHGLAQQELIGFFETLSQKNQIIYTTHSPFLIDGEHLHRVRPVMEDDTGHSRISADGSWPKDRETIFPLQAAAGYAMLRGLFQHKKNVLVEGMSDYYYLHALSQQCRATGRAHLPDDIYITPCGGTKHVGNIAALFLGQETRPIILLDGDDAARVRRDNLMKELYVGHESGIIMLDDVLGRSGQEVEIEDILGETILFCGIKAALGKNITVTNAEKKAGGLPSQIKAAAQRMKINLPDGWKATVAIHLVSSWADQKTTLPVGVLDEAAKLFAKLEAGFGNLETKAGKMTALSG